MKYLVINLLSLLLLLVISPAYANTQQTEQVTIKADNFEIDRKNGTSTFTGHVSMQQGEMSFRADKVILYRTDQAVDKIHAYGQPAHFTREVSVRNKALVASRANRMEYDARSEQLILLGDAFLTQDGNQFSGEQIEYDIRRDIVKAQRQATFIVPTPAANAQEVQ